jgi:sodium transport system permease protein
MKDRGVGDPTPRHVSGSGGLEGTTPSIRSAVGLVVLVAFLYLVGGIPFQLAFGEVGLLLSQLLLMGLPPVLYCVIRDYDLVRTFSIRLPTASQLAGGLVLLATGLVIAWFLAWAQSLVTPVPTEYMEAMAAFITADSPARFLWLIALVAVVPAISEELVFRGVLLSGFRSRAPAWAAVILTGLLFGLFHLSPATGFRVLPTAWMGMVLAWVVIASGSLPLAILLHFVNNALIVVLASAASTRGFVTDTETAPPFLLLALALAGFAWGLILLGRPDAEALTRETSGRWRR